MIILKVSSFKNKFFSMNFAWAEPYPDLYKVCTLFQLTELCNPTKFHYKPLPAFIQDGPQCGLVALAMCMQSCSKETVQSLFVTAKEKNFTYNGEMFSANDLASLAEEFLSPKSATVQVYSGHLNCDEVKEFLLKGGLMLVPYDSDKNNSPCLQNGHKAHWAAISGAVQTAEDCFVLARHGKAKNVAVWKLIDLAQSNSQLLQFSPDRKLQDVDYKLPHGGIDGPFGLNNKAVFIQFLNRPYP